MSDNTQSVSDHTPESSPPPAQTTGNPSPVLMIFLIIPLIGILVALVMVVVENQNRPQSTTITAPDGYPSNVNLIDFEAPLFDMLNLDGELMRLDDYRGRIVFLNFWQTTCPPCVEELPALAAFEDAQSADGAAVLAVNFDETAAMVRDFFSANDIDEAPTILMDTESRYRRLYGVVQIPTTFIIDGEGIVRRMHLGPLTEDVMFTYLDEIQALETETSES